MSADHPAINDHQSSITLSCSNCVWLSQIRSDGQGECWRNPPQVIVLVSQRADLASAQMGMVQRPTKVRPTMQPGEYCGQFAPCPPGFTRPVADAGPH
jgi:hypothetical protein